MMNVTMIARTASIAKDYVNETRQGRNGQFQSKSIMFSMACDRKYRTTTVTNGQQVQDNPTDFWLVKFVGGAADTMQKYATSKKADGKLVSRHLYMEGTFETYRSTKPIKATMKNMNFNGQVMDIPGMATPDGDGITQVIFVVDYFQFIDSNPNASNNNSVQNAPMQFMQGQNFAMPMQQGFQQPMQGQAMPTFAQPAMPVAPAQVAAPVAPVTPIQQTAPVAPQQKPAIPTSAIPAPAPAGVVPAAPVAPVQPQQNVSTANTQPNGFSNLMQNVAQQMASQQAQNAAPTAPTIPANFQPTGGSAPF